jgi:hypothetical protein
LTLPETAEAWFLGGEPDYRHPVTGARRENHADTPLMAAPVDDDITAL